MVKKRVSWGSKPYSFRLRVRGENDGETPQNVQIETEISEILDGWISNRPNGVSAHARLVEIIVRLVLEREHQTMPASDGGSIDALARLVNRRFDSLTRKFDEKTGELLRAIVQNPRAMATMNDVHEKHNSGQAIDNSFLDNLLSDFDR